jgi:hypothetical protein
MGGVSGRLNPQGSFLGVFVSILFLSWRGAGYVSVNIQWMYICASQWTLQGHSVYPCFLPSDPEIWHISWASCQDLVYVLMTCL